MSLRHRSRWWVIGVVVAIVAAAEWLHQPRGVWVAAAAAAAAGGVAVLWPLTSWRRRGLALAAAALVLALGIAEQRLTRIEEAWPEEREARITAASTSLNGDLHAAFHRAQRLANAAIATTGDEREDAFRRLRTLVPRMGPEAGVVVLDRGGAPWAWAGRHRLAPQAAGDSIAARWSGYYVVLEARRHSPTGETAVASVLIWAHPAVPERDRSLAELFRQRTEVGLAVFPPGTAPDSADVFDYAEPTTAGPRLLFSVQPIPPEQGVARQLAFDRASRVITWLVLVVLALAVSLARTPVERYLVLPVVLWVAVRAPVGAALDLVPLFSPATFFRALLGPLSASAGILALTGTLVTMVGIWLWRRGLPRRWWGVGLGVVLLILSPYVISGLGRGITPPAAGVPMGLWLTWQLTLFGSGSALIVLTAALFRGIAPEPSSRGRIVLGVAIALIASIVGVVIWSPHGGWPGWYTFLWTPALLLVTLPAPRTAAIAGIALVAGSSAALVTWGAELSGKLQVAQRDVARLGDEPDPLALPLLERFGERAEAVPPPATASQMYALWRGSALGEQGYPAHLALWTEDGVLQAELPLDSLDLPASLLSTLVRGLPDDTPSRITQLQRVPGIHYVLLRRLDDGGVMTTAIGPRSQLVAPSRLGRLLNPEARRARLYRLTLAPPADPEAEVQRLRWRREGWVLRAEHTLELPGGPRTVHALVDLRGPVPLLVRGVLVMLLDAALLAALWFVAELAAGMRPPRPRWRTFARSFRIRLAVTLAAFFILPAVGFAVWGLRRLAAEAERSRDLLIMQTLRDAVLTSGGLRRLPPPLVEERLRELSRRIDADLAFYEGGGLVATSAPVLEDLGVMARLMDPSAFAALALRGELEATRNGTIPQLAERIGFRVVHPGAARQLGVLATPQLADDTTLAVRQLDLALVLVLTTLAGVAAALYGAQAASRFLSRPVAELRRSALALGKGQPMPPHSEHPPVEFEPVFGAFERMAADIRASQNALEEARRRTAAVLATVATGVVGLDPSGRIIIANRQAVDLVGAPLPEGASFYAGLGPEWTPLAEAVRRFLARPESADTSTELDIAGRRLTLQLASLGPDVSGAVLALSDVTDLSRAERVLAWGEMARQVAHEIKNPLTPMRLGMQHLRRVYRDRRGDFDRTLEETSARILGEIDRLDTIARAFSRFAAPADDHQPLERVDLVAAVGDVVQLYRLAGEGAEVRLDAEPGATGAARRDEVKEVVVNLLENARAAEAQCILVTVAPGLVRVRDDGVGITAELLPHIFEPRFSTTTSGSGLGLAIVRRLVESWGGRVDVESEVGRGTTVTVWLAP